MSKEFVHTFAVVVANDILINTFDLRRRDVDQATAFAYHAKAQQNYVSVVADEIELDATFYHSEDKKTFTRLVVRSQEDAKTCCERCAALRGQAHEKYCDVSVQEKTASAVTASAEKKTALSVLSKLTLKSAVSTSVKASEDAQASDDDEEDVSEEQAKSEDAQASKEQASERKSVREKLAQAKK